MVENIELFIGLDVSKDSHLSLGNLTSQKFARLCCVNAGGGGFIL